MAARTGKSNITITIIQEINRLYKLGNNIATVSRMLKLSHGAVGNHIWEPRTQGKPFEMNRG